METSVPSSLRREKVEIIIDVVMCSNAYVMIIFVLYRPISAQKNNNNNNHTIFSPE